ncbi:uncharacterized protein ATNIH1004_007445 [Aspergillus tanneri]|uniref:Major facilitator superfamily (MFS) profile domain-containing protein n=1 Tax=Aspergillus tanneri TaxID=1220188 RepID=A0A5M9MM21_9EURO|nr:uncharacterized protein ATNIH1004_007445 [Aspergillus tanneri]KAA8646023.1 hypothetical protein ATNIH1004_007445 [Aspergillus tanneri]
MIFPFAYFMVNDFDPNDVRHVGLRDGLITSAFFIPQMITTIPYGIASDRYGRRPLLLTGLLGSAAFLCPFGLYKPFPWALITRALCGFCNGNAASTRTVAGETVYQANLNQGRVFAIFEFTQAVGYVGGRTHDRRLSS